MLTRLFAGLTGALALTSGALALEPGDPAPPLQTVSWIKGEPISEFQKGHVYVLDFWATWCKPCIASIPHLNELQSEYRDKDVHVVGLAIWPTPNMTPTPTFVEEQGDQMNYWVGEDVENALAMSYMAAAGRNGIPTAFVIDKEGKVAWVGHPMDGLDRIVGQIVNDEFSLEKLEAERKKSQELEGALMEAYTQSDWPAVIDVTEQMLSLDEKKYSAAAVYKYIALVKNGGEDEAARAEAQKKARAWGAQITSTIFADDADSLHALAWNIIGPDSDLTEAERDTKFALLVAEKASGLRNHEDISVLDTLARAYFADAQPRKAAETQEKAIKLLDKEFETYSDNPDIIAQLTDIKSHLQSTLDEYQAAVPDEQ